MALRYGALSRLGSVLAAASLAITACGGQATPRTSVVDARLAPASGAPDGGGRLPSDAGPSSAARRSPDTTVRFSPPPTTVSSPAKPGAIVAKPTPVIPAGPAPPAAAVPAPAAVAVIGCGPHRSSRPSPQCPPG